MKIRKRRLRPKRMGTFSNALHPATKMRMIFAPLKGRPGLYGLNLWRSK